MLYWHASSTISSFVFKIPPEGKEILPKSLRHAAQLSKEALGMIQLETFALALNLDPY